MENTAHKAYRCTDHGSDATAHEDGIYFVVPCIVACVTTVWFGVGGVIGLRQLFRDLRARKETNVLDDGRVEGHISLADKQRLEAVDRENKEQTK